MDVFKTLNAVNVNDFTEKKNGLTYLSWAHAWAHVAEKFPEASYTIWKDEHNLPYVYDPLTGYMVYTSVTIDGITREMWLPVMDSGNNAMKAEPYEITTRYGKKIPVAAATMFDINKAIMRCLTKNLSMFGLGLYIYAGEDLPTVDEEPEKPKPAPITEGKKVEDLPKEKPKRRTAKKVEEPVKEPETLPFVDAKPTVEMTAKAKVLAYIERHHFDLATIRKLCDLYRIETLSKMTAQQAQHYISVLERKGISIDE